MNSSGFKNTESGTRCSVPSSNVNTKSSPSSLHEIGTFSSSVSICVVVPSSVFSVNTPVCALNSMVLISLSVVVLSAFKSSFSSTFSVVSHRSIKALSVARTSCTVVPSTPLIAATPISPAPPVPVRSSITPFKAGRSSFEFESNAAFSAAAVICGLSSRLVTGCTKLVIFLSSKPMVSPFYAFFFRLA